VTPRRRGPPGFRATGLRRPRSHDRVRVLNRRGAPARSSTTSRSTSIPEPTRRGSAPQPLTHQCGCARPARPIRVATYTCVALRGQRQRRRWALTGIHRFQLAGRSMGVSGKDIGALKRNSGTSPDWASHRGSAGVPMRLSCITPPIGGGNCRGSDRAHPGRLIPFARACVTAHTPPQRPGRFSLPW
jgi:hypothetical protein